jgi:hypothetical protein
MTSISYHALTVVVCYVKYSIFYTFNFDCGFDLSSGTEVTLNRQIAKMPMVVQWVYL